MVSGYITLMVLIILICHCVGRRQQSNRVRHCLQKIHRPLGIGIFAMILIHFVLTYKIWDMRAISVIITGVITTIVCIGILITYVLRKRYPKVWLRWHRIGAVCVTLALISHIVVYFIDFDKYKQNVEEITIEGIDAENISDGTYYGECDAGYIKAAVSVIVSEGEILDIRLEEHKNERGKKAESVISEIINNQTTQVDTVSGATNSSKVILQAVENALLSAGKE